ncbi:MAG: hypothetical protein LBB45_08460 [Methanobrevibacter sp.]|nr:hypothetical protein [Candidatus Methanovirga basalitermitum]
MFANYTPSLSAVFSDTANGGSSNGHKISNCSFENLRGTGEFPATIGVYDNNAKYNVTECFFRNISSTHASRRAGGFQCNMNNNNNFGYYNVTANTFIEIRTNRSTIQLTGSFSSLIFDSNSFYNVSANAQGGVLKFNKFIYLFIIILFRQFMLVIQFQVLSLDLAALLIVQAHKVIFFILCYDKHN